MPRTAPFCEKVTFRKSATCYIHKLPWRNGSNSFEWLVSSYNNRPAHNVLVSWFSHRVRLTNKEAKKLWHNRNMTEKHTNKYRKLSSEGAVFRIKYGGIIISSAFAQMSFWRLQSRIHFHVIQFSINMIKLFISFSLIWNSKQTDAILYSVLPHIRPYGHMQ